jgi:hypothetical protein
VHGAPSPPLVVGAQSPSTAFVQPAGQQPSPDWHAEMRVFEQVTLHCEGLPLRTSAVQASESLQLVRQLPSHVSAPSTTPLPQPAQSWSFAKVQPDGQQPSFDWHAAIGAELQAAVQVAALPMRRSLVQVLPSLQSLAVGHAPGEPAGMA